MSRGSPLSGHRARDAQTPDRERGSPVARGPDGSTERLAPAAVAGLFGVVAGDTEPLAVDEAGRAAASVRHDVVTLPDRRIAPRCGAAAVADAHQFGQPVREEARARLHRDELAGRVREHPANLHGRSGEHLDGIEWLLTSTRSACSRPSGAAAERCRATNAAVSTAWAAATCAANVSNAPTRTRESSPAIASPTRSGRRAPQPASTSGDPHSIARLHATSQAAGSDSFWLGFQRRHRGCRSSAPTQDRQP